MGARESILAKLRSKGPKTPHPGRFEWRADYGDLKTRFEQRFEFHDGEICDHEETRELLHGAFIEPDAAGLIDVAATNHSDIWAARVSVTTVVAAIAETGTLVLEAGPGLRRLASLAPEIHIALVRSSQIVATLDDAIDQLKDRTAVWITGPSRTADIEGILIKGVHGPKRVIVVWLD